MTADGLGKGKGVYRLKATWRNLLLTASIVSLILFASACKKGIPFMTESRQEQGYTKAQIMLIIATEKNRYRDVYTDQIWQVPVDDEGNLFQSYLLEEIQGFLQKLRTINLLAAERGISLTAEEETELAELADRFYEGMTEADKAYTGAGREDVLAMYREYHLANKMVDELTKDADLEISDSEARVITVQEIVLDDQQAAEAVWERVSETEADFQAAAREATGQTVQDVNIGRGERSEYYEKEVFSLETGQVSSVIDMSGQYYIVKCINDFDEEATLARKDVLLLERKQQAFQGIYEAFAAEHPVEIGGNLWNDISFSEGADSVTTDFFLLYREYMGEGA